jgi:hypothetical protein
MTLANMRAQGVRSLWAVCELCHREAVLNVDGYGDAVPVSAFGPRHGVYSVWHHRRARTAELAGAPAAREPDRQAVV